MYFLIGADTVPTASNADLFCAGDANALVGEELNEILRQASFRIFNLECPLTESDRQNDKFGVLLKAPPAAVNGYRALGADLLTLANNHIMDYSARGLAETIMELDAAGIAHVGAGTSAAEAAEPYYFTFAGKTVGVYACAEHEFSIAGEDTPGANPFEPLESPDHVQSMKERCDYAIVLYHGGKEYYRYPSPQLRKTCRKLIEKGADLVICQHSHCVGCMETYHGGTAVYGQGNFLFRFQDGTNTYANSGLLISLDEQFQISFLPIERNDTGVILSHDSDIASGFFGRSMEIQEPGFVEQRFHQLTESLVHSYLKMLLKEDTFFLKAVKKLIGKKKLEQRLSDAISANHAKLIENLVTCEAHREILLDGLKQRRGQ